MQEYARQETRALLHHLDSRLHQAAPGGDAEVIHDLRVAIRRLRVCLKLFSHFYPGRSWKKMRRRLSGLMEMCGAVRDRDIAIAQLTEASLPIASPLLRNLALQRTRAERELRRELKRWNKAGMHRRWTKRLEL